MTQEVMQRDEELMLPMKDAMWNYIENFIEENAPYGEPSDDELLWEQTRALLTSYALIWHIDLDTAEWDELSRRAYLLTERGYGLGSLTYFDCYMGKYLA